MTKQHYWRAEIVTRIPADIDPAKHDGIRKTFAAINDRLADKRWTTKEYAEGVAAIALSDSGCGACGYPAAHAT